MRLTPSRDGRHWSRVGRRQFIPLGKPDDWDPDYHEPTWDPVRMGDELWIYYRSARSGKRDPKGMDAIGLAILRRDGFVSLNAGTSTDVVTTRPLSFAGRRLFLNAEVQDEGWIKVALLSRENEPIREHTRDDAVPITPGATELPDAWKTAQVLHCPASQHVRLQFAFSNARLYSFWIE
jgi:hypothetical protein